MMAVLSLISLASFEAVLNLPVSAQLLGDVRAAVYQIRKLEIMDKEPSNLLQYGEIQEKFSMGLEIKNLSFRYSSQTSKVLSNINIHLNRGEKIAIVGESGSGKSTLLNILLGFYRDYEGEILLNGIDNLRFSEGKQREFFSSGSADPYFF